MFLIENEEAVHKAFNALENAGIKRPNGYRIDRNSITFYQNQTVMGKLQYRYRGDKLIYITEQEIAHKGMR
jgi:hypothetical protein